MEVNPLVFETSASTNSAIWACAKSECKSTYIFEIIKVIAPFFAIGFLISILVRNSLLSLCIQLDVEKTICHERVLIIEI